MSVTTVNVAFHQVDDATFNVFRNVLRDVDRGAVEADVIVACPYTAAFYSAKVKLSRVMSETVSDGVPMTIHNIEPDLTDVCDRILGDLPGLNQLLIPVNSLVYTVQCIGVPAEYHFREGNLPIPKSRGVMVAKMHMSFGRTVLFTEARIANSDYSEAIVYVSTMMGGNSIDQMLAMLVDSSFCGVDFLRKGDINSIAEQLRTAARRHSGHPYANLAFLRNYDGPLVSDDGDAQTCDKCGVSSATLGRRIHACKGCSIARYCSKECQVADWKNHKPACINLLKNAPLLTLSLPAAP